MAAETIIVYIHPTQLRAQKKNKYSLFLAKMVNRELQGDLAVERADQLG
jgi:hypothetical protein